ncbi:MAG TPA: Hsp20/alpha crystallin family protein [Capillimicrobium sp.]|nr:Hsp20/alpha crystallin family protein [Capillimicrobium sp.]
MATTMTRWRPFAELEDMRRRMERMFEEIGDGKGRSWTLAIDLVERDDRYVLRADVPGIKPEDVKIEVDDDVLTVSAEHEESEEEKQDSYVRRERRYGSFSRSITLPKGVGADDIEATCKDGVLEVSFPKPKEEERKPITITPKAA